MRISISIPIFLTYVFSVKQSNFPQRMCFINKDSHISDLILFEIEGNRVGVNQFF